MARTVAAADMTNEFLTEKVKYRGVVYTIKELSMSAYDKSVAQFTNIDAETKVRDFDGPGHTRMLLSRCVTVGGEPLDVDGFYRANGARMGRSLTQKVLDLHLEPEPEEVIEDGDEGEAPAEAKA